MKKLLTTFVLIILVVVAGVAAASYWFISTLTLDKLNSYTADQMPDGIEVEFIDMPSVALFSSPTLAAKNIKLSIRGEEGVDQYQITDSEITIDLRKLYNDQIIDAHSIKANLGDYGKYEGDAFYQLNDSHAKLTGTLSDIRLAQLSEHIYSGTAKAVGSVNYAISSNDHQGSFNIISSEATILGVDADHMLCSAISKARGRASTTSNSNQTNLAAIDAKLTLAGTQLTIDEAKSSTSNLSLAPTGWFNIESNDYQIDSELNVGNREYCAAMSKDLAAEPWPITCKGNLDADDVSCGLNQSVIKDRIRQELRDKVKDKLKSLFSR